MRNQTHPPKFKEWLKKVESNEFLLINYTDKIDMTVKIFNMSEVMDQMCSEAKISVLFSILSKCMDENERSLFFSGLQEAYKNK